MPKTHIGPVETLPLLLSATTLPGRPLGILGFPLGYDSLHRPVWFDPSYMQGYRLINSGIFGVLGAFNTGKTALLKLLALMFVLSNSPQPGRRARIIIDDNRLNNGESEWKSLIENALGGTEVHLARAKFNLLDPALKLNEAQQMSMLLGTLQQLTGIERLPTSHGTALREALRRLHKMPHNQQTVETLVRILNASDTLLPTVPGTHELLHIKREVIEDACSQLCQSLGQLIDPYGHGRTFGGNGSIATDLGQSVVALDYTGVNTDLLAIIQSVLWQAWSSAKLRQDPGLMPDIMICDENNRMWRDSPVYAKAMFDHMKVLRGTGGTVILSTQKLSDYNTTGSPFATSIIGEVSGWFIGHLESEHAREIVEFLGLPRMFVEVIATLQMGQFVYARQNMDPLVFTVYLPEFVRQFTESNQATTATLTGA